MTLFFHIALNKLIKIYIKYRNIKYRTKKHTLGVLQKDPTDFEDQ